MLADPWGPLLLQLAFILLNGWLAATEAAVLSLNDSKLRQRAEEGDKGAERLLRLNESPARILSTLQVCIMVAGFMSAAFAAKAFAPGLHAATGLPEDACLVIVTVILALCTLLLGEMLPKRLGMHAPEKTVSLGLPVVSILSVVLLPVVWILTVVTNLLLRLLGIDPHAIEEEVTEDDIRQMVDMGEESGAIEETEKEMIDNIFEFNNRIAENVMTHRTDVAAIWVDEDWKVILDTIRETGLSRFPVYNEDMDDIIGTLNTRVFLLNMQAEKPRTMREMIHEAYFVPETVQADQLFRDMQTKKVHMAIVIDEYGGMSGIVTMEDLLEEIVGNIYDEFDKQVEAEIVKVGENQWRIPGQAMLEDVAETLEVELPLEEDYDTLGGLIFSQFTIIPDDGTTPELDCCGLHIQVEKIEEHRVETALVSKLATGKKEETD